MFKLYQSCSIDVDEGDYTLDEGEGVKHGCGIGDRA
jgi:hypothetical protein